MHLRVQVPSIDSEFSDQEKLLGDEQRGLPAPDSSCRLKVLVRDAHIFLLLGDYPHTRFLVKEDPHWDQKPPTPKQSYKELLAGQTLAVLHFQGGRKASDRTGALEI